MEKRRVNKSRWNDSTLERLYEMYGQLESLAKGSQFTQENVEKIFGPISQKRFIRLCVLYKIHRETR